MAILDDFRFGNCNFFKQIGRQVGVYKMPDDNGIAADMEGIDFVFHQSIGDRDSLVLPHVLSPRFDEKCLQLSLRI